MKVKNKKVFRKLIALACFVLSLQSSHAKDASQYLRYLEDTENVILTNVEEEISFSQENDKVVATRKVHNEYFTARYKETYTEYITYDNDMRKLKNVKHRAKGGSTINHSSKKTPYGIFYDGLNLCSINLYFSKKNDEGQVNYDFVYSDVIYLAKVNFAEDLFVAEKKITVEVPEWLDMDIVETNFNKSISKVVKTGSKSKIYTYTVKNQKAPKDEKYSESVACSYPSLLFVYKGAKMKNGEEKTIFRSAQDQYKWYKNLQEGVVVKNDSICKETDRIISHCKTEREKISAIYEWVHENIRYIAFEDGVAGFRPKPANEVMDNKYGDCKGMANLLCGMLSCAGVDARLVWIGTKSLPYDYSTPSLAVDNHAICAAILGNDTIYLDGTCSYAPVGHNPSSIAGKATMISNGENCVLSRVPQNVPHENLDSIYLNMTISKDGMSGQFNQYKTGDIKISFMANMEDNDRDIYETLESLDYSGLPFDEETVKIYDGKPSDPSVRIEYPMDCGKNISTSGSEYYVCMDAMKALASYDVDTVKRRGNLLLPCRSEYSYVGELNIPKGYHVSYLPKDFSVDKSKYSFDIKYEKKGNKVIYKRRVTIKDPLIKKTNFREWNNDIIKLRNAYHDMVVLSPGASIQNETIKENASAKNKATASSKNKKNVKKTKK